MKASREVRNVSWSDAMGTPTGDLGVVGFEEIEAVRVPC